MATFQGKTSFCEGSLHFKDSWSTSDEEFWLQKIRHYAGGPNGMDYIKYIFFNYFEKGAKLGENSGMYDYQVPKQGILGMTASGGVMKRALYCLIEDILDFKTPKLGKFGDEKINKSWMEILEPFLKEKEPPDLADVIFYIMNGDEGEIREPQKNNNISLFQPSARCDSTKSDTYEVNPVIIRPLTIYKMFEIVKKIITYYEEEWVKRDIVKHWRKPPVQAETIGEKLLAKVKMNRASIEVSRLHKKIIDGTATHTDKNKYLKLKWERGNKKEGEAGEKSYILLPPNIFEKYDKDREIVINKISYNIKKKSLFGGRKKRKKRKSRRKKKRRKSKRRKSKRRKSKRRRKKHVSRKRR